MGNKSFPLSKLDNQRLNTFSNKMIYNWVLISPKKQQKNIINLSVLLQKMIGWETGTPRFCFRDTDFLTMPRLVSEVVENNIENVGCLGGSANNNRGDSHHQRLEKLAPLNCLSGITIIISGWPTLG